MHAHGRGRELGERAPDVSQQEAVCCQAGGESAGPRSLLHPDGLQQNIKMSCYVMENSFVVVFMDPIS